MRKQHMVKVWARRLLCLLITSILLSSTNVLADDEKFDYPIIKISDSKTDAYEKMITEKRLEEMYVLRHTLDEPIVEIEALNVFGGTGNSQCFSIFLWVHNYEEYTVCIDVNFQLMYPDGTIGSDFFIRNFVEGYNDFSVDLLYRYHPLAPANGRYRYIVTLYDSETGDFLDEQTISWVRGFVDHELMEPAVAYS